MCKRGRSSICMTSKLSLPLAYPLLPHPTPSPSGIVLAAPSLPSPVPICIFFGAAHPLPCTASSVLCIVSSAFRVCWSFFMSYHPRRRRGWATRPVCVQPLSCHCSDLYAMSSHFKAKRTHTIAPCDTTPLIIMWRTQIVLGGSKPYCMLSTFRASATGVGASQVLWARLPPIHIGVPDATTTTTSHPARHHTHCHVLQHPVHVAHKGAHEPPACT